MPPWQLHQAKARLSELIETAETEGAQIITSRGVERAAVVPIDEFRSWKAERPDTLLEILQSAPFADLPIPPRGKLRHRKPVKF